MKKILTILGLTLSLGTTSLLATSPMMKIAGKVNDMIITVAEADKALDVLTKGKKTWDTLEAPAKKQLIQMMAPSKIVAAKAKKSLTKKEKSDALSGFWMQKKMSETKITDKEAQKAYNKMKKMAKKSKSKRKIPTFEAVKNDIKMQLAQEKVVAGLMKNAKIKLK
jgi:hypothetical protein